MYCTSVLGILACDLRLRGSWNKLGALLQSLEKALDIYELLFIYEQLQTFLSSLEQEMEDSGDF